MQRICKAISQETGRNKTLLAQETVIKTLNRMMVGWANYFCLGPVSKAYRAIERHARYRLRQWLRAKHSCKGRQLSSFQLLPCIRCWAWSNLLLGHAAFRGRNRDTFSESRMREMRPVRKRKQNYVKPVRRRGESLANSHRETTATAPVLDSTQNPSFGRQQHPYHLP